MKLSEKLQILEALLFAAPEPLTQTRVNLIFQNDAPNLEDVIKKLNEHYEKNKRSYIRFENLFKFQKSLAKPLLNQPTAIREIVTPN